MFVESSYIAKFERQTTTNRLVYENDPEIVQIVMVDLIHVIFYFVFRFYKIFSAIDLFISEEMVKNPHEASKSF